MADAMRFLGIDAINAIYGGCLLVALLFGWFKWLHAGAKRKLAKVGGFVEAVAGRDEIVDKASGIVKAPAVPPLGVRLASVDETLQKLVAVVDATHNHELRLNDHTLRLDAHDAKFVDLERASEERTATANVSAEFLKLVRDRDVIDGESDET